MNLIKKVLTTLGGIFLAALLIAALAPRASADSDLFTVSATFVNAGLCPGCTEDVTGSFVVTVVPHVSVSVTDIALSATGTLDENDWTSTPCSILFVNASPFCFDATATGDELLLVFPSPIGSSGSLGGASSYAFAPPPHGLAGPPLKLSSGTYSIESLTAPTPEPSTILLLIGGIASLVVAAQIKQPAS